MQHCACVSCLCTIKPAQVWSVVVVVVVCYCHRCELVKVAQREARRAPTWNQIAVPAEKRWPVENSLQKRFNLLPIHTHTNTGSIAVLAALYSLLVCCWLSSFTHTLSCLLANPSGIGFGFGAASV